MQTPDLFRKWQAPILTCSLFALIAAVFYPALHNGFVDYDDPDYVAGNWHVQQGLTWTGLKWAFTTVHAGNWHPVTWLSHQIDAEMFGPLAWGSHLTSVLLHAINSALLFLLLRQLTGSTWRSFFVAVLFGLNPLRVESVAWVSERKDVLSATFFLLVLLAYTAYCKARAPSETTGQPGAAIQAKHRRLFNSQASIPYLACLALFCLGLMSKPMIVTLPFVLLIVDFWPLGRHQTSSLWSLIREKLPFLGAAIAASAVTMIAQKSGGAILSNTPLPCRLENAAVSYVRYIGKLFWPVKLSPFYPPVEHWSALTVAGSVLAIGALLFLGLLLRKRCPFVLAGSLWFLGMLVPVIGLVKAGEQAMADRYTYLPSIGLLILLVWCLEIISASFRPLRAISIALGICTATLWAPLTRAQISYWHDTETLFTRALQVNPGNYLALNNLGAAKDKVGEYDEAIKYFSEAIKQRPGYAQAHNNMGVVLFEAGRIEEALNQFQQALRTDPGYADAHNNMGSALVRLGRAEEAFEQFAQAVRLKPSHADAQYNLGLQLIRKHRFDEAIYHLQAAAQIQPQQADAHNNLGFAYQQTKQLDLAIAEYRRSIQLRPQHARAHFNLGVALYEKGLLNESIAEFRSALKLQPNYPEAQKNLNALLELKK